MGKVKLFFGKLKGMWSEPPKGRYLNLKEMGSFGLYALGNSFISNAAMYVVTITYIPYFYGIDVIHAYVIMILGNSLNLLLQPILGSLMERTNTKIGRYKPFILLSLPLFCLAAITSTWIPQFEMETARIVYAYLSCVPLILLSTYANNMFSTMPNVVTPNPQERADLMTPISLLVGLAPSIMQIIAGPIRAHFVAEGQEYMGLRIIGVVAVIIGVCCVFFILKVKERVYDLGETKRREKLGFKKSFVMLMNNKPLWILFAALIVGSLREFWRTYMPLIVQLRFAENVSDALTISGLPLSVVGFASTVAMLLLPIVTRKFDHRKIIILFSMGNILSMTILSAVGFQNIPVGATSAVVITLLFFLAGINPIWILIPLMMGDIADHQQLKTGKRMEGHLQSLLFTVPALLSQVSMLGAWVIQKKIGFEPKNYTANAIITAAQQEIANDWFRMTCIISLVSALLLVLVIAFYPLGKKRHEQILSELKVLAERGKNGSGFVEGEAVGDGNVGEDFGSKEGDEIGNDAENDLVGDNRGDTGASGSEEGNERGNGAEKDLEGDNCGDTGASGSEEGNEKGNGAEKD